MSAVHTSKGAKAWRYYRCTNAEKRGWQVCPNKSVSAIALERFVVNEIKVIGRDPTLVAEVIDAANRHITERQKEIASERAVAQRDLTQSQRDLRGAKEPGYLADLHERIAGHERRIAQLDAEAHRLRSEVIHDHDVREALAEFDGVWAMLSPREQWRVMQGLIECVVVDKPGGIVRITFKPTGIRGLAAEQSRHATADAA